MGGLSDEGSKRNHSRGTRPSNGGRLFDGIDGSTEPEKNAAAPATGLREKTVPRARTTDVRLPKTGDGSKTHRLATLRSSGPQAPLRRSVGPPRGARLAELLPSKGDGSCDKDR